MAAAQNQYPEMGSSRCSFSQACSITHSKAIYWVILDPRKVLFQKRCIPRTIHIVDISQCHGHTPLLSQAESVMTRAPETASLYLAATGDNNGVKTESGNTVLDCWQDHLLGLLRVYVCLKMFKWFKGMETLDNQKNPVAGRRCHSSSLYTIMRSVSH